MNSIKLSIEQEFNLQAFNLHAQSLTRGEAIDILVQLYRQNVVKDAMYKEMLMEQLGVGLPRHE